MTLAPEIQSLIEWGDAVVRRNDGLALPELRATLRDEHDRGLLVPGSSETIARNSEVMQWPKIDS